ncbi:HET-domain-containing protein [Alternaria alternata]|jgi:hypothetical protein|uniref:HET-domain-containing protein n=2 Tax=Alternaria alternata complex TaxID=187734 RepID=A0A177DST8_ALTAL|nr:HET-domain-containing protein [Alternaria alternata]RYN38302.1 hypothetical protein AA0115_g593 [Alternaria tenuissima]OAG22062.1 HET-domain-containing protein [Alternaria alternata]OWY48583.1 HET-like protein [Alternaria alternata]RYN99737.1 hypothetical protein AA0119_g6605 [Alternaria tenuissima]RYO25654.1 hypothetical protein AA0121_g196 [Alternaria tenuissima]
MSCRSQSDAYKSALTDRFTDTTESKLLDIRNLEVFKHQPLQDPSTELRYLYLLPRTHNIDIDGQTVVCCELVSNADEQGPSYVGLSYAWGDAQIRRPILVGNKVFHATENLAVALEHLQEKDKTITFWIDAICIDQSNSNEKSVQVQRMGDIFTSAVVVIAWIGPATEDSDLALQELERYGEDVTSWEWLSSQHRERSVALPFASIKSLLARPWFKRVWVGQEAALNERVIFICGQHDIHRRQLFDSLKGYWASSMALRGDSLSLSFNRFEHTKPLPFYDVLNHFDASISFAVGSELESSDPRDFVYSAFGRINDIEECGLRVDYTKSVEEVYTEFTEAIIRAGKIDLLEDALRPSSTYRNLPSWVPDWSETSVCGILGSSLVLKYDVAEICENERGGNALRISAQRNARISRVENGLQLQLQQGVLGLNLSNPGVINPQEEEEVMSFLNIIQGALGRKNRWRPGEVDKALFDLSTGMSIARYTIEDDEEISNDLYMSYQAFRGLATPPDDIPDPQSWRRDASYAYLNILRDSNIKKFFMTSEDIVGVSRDDLQPDDWVCVLGGLERACVLREIGDGHYRIVSFANVFPWEDVANNDAPVEVLTIV